MHQSEVPSHGLVTLILNSLEINILIQHNTHNCSLNGVYGNISLVLFKIQHLSYAIRQENKHFDVLTFTVNVTFI